MDLRDRKQVEDLKAMRYKRYCPTKEIKRRKM